MFDRNLPAVRGAFGASRNSLIAVHCKAALAQAVSIVSFRPDAPCVNGVKS